MGDALKSASWPRQLLTLAGRSNRPSYCLQVGGGFLALAQLVRSKSCEVVPWRVFNMARGILCSDLYKFTELLIAV
jgi:hypothetical protein